MTELCKGALFVDYSFQKGLLAWKFVSKLLAGCPAHAGTKGIMLWTYDKEKQHENSLIFCSVLYTEHGQVIGKLGYK